MLPHSPRFVSRNRKMPIHVTDGRSSSGNLARAVDRRNKRTAGINRSPRVGEDPKETARSSLL